MNYSCNYRRQQYICLVLTIQRKILLLKIEMASTCEKHSSLERSQYCMDCKVLLCALCQFEHAVTNPTHKITSMADILCIIMTFYKDLATPNDDEKIISQLKERISQIKCFGECVKVHTTSVCDTLTCSQAAPLIEALKATESAAAKKKLVCDPETIKKLTDQFIKKEYTNIVDLYHQLPELKANLTSIKQECASVSQELPVTVSLDFTKVKEPIEKFIEYIFNGIDYDKVVSQISSNMVSPCGICKKLSYICCRCKQACTLCGKDVICEKCCINCEQCKNLHCIICLENQFSCDICNKMYCGINGIECCGKLGMLTKGKLYTFTSTSQFSSNNTTHWYPEKMINPRDSCPFGFDGGRLGWVQWNMSSNPQMINKLVYVANSGNRIAVEYSKDGNSFIEAAQFVDDKPVCVVKIDIKERCSFLRVRMIKSAGRSPYHHAMWYYQLIFHIYETFQQFYVVLVI
eukprot:TRINITY_DN470_c0_g3_i1.p1 TRINITY_DN470_c0_g3~~TRINITY_DN470_c0_g3_i1.p1  ORF type:complete len:462 (+),score=15.10 TRINITY_DN470_c0_g3_i1:344-1729(+)